VLDGEAVVLGVDGMSDFDALQSRQHDDEAQLYAFDMLAGEGEDLRKLPLFLRKRNLARLLVRRLEGIHAAEFEQGEIGPDLFRAACKMGLEGLVSKHRERAYRGGRCAHWVKIKNPEHPGYNGPRTPTGGARGQSWRTPEKASRRPTELRDWNMANNPNRNKIRRENEREEAQERAWWNGLTEEQKAIEKEKEARRRQISLAGIAWAQVGRATWDALPLADREAWRRVLESKHIRDNKHITREELEAFLRIDAALSNVNYVCGG
jgi:ATP dependent DNA ligase domain